MRKNFSHRTIYKYVKSKALSPLPFPEKIPLLFALFGLFLAGSRTGSQVRGSESKFDISCFTHTIPGQLPVKKNVVPTLSSFAAVGYKGFSSFAAFLVVTPTIPSKSVRSRKISWFRQINLVPRVPSFSIQTKFRLKYLVTTVYLLRCKEISLFFYCKLKNIDLMKPLLRWLAWLI